MPRRSPSSSSGLACCPAAAFEGTTYERKFREIIQSIRLTQEFPGVTGKQQIITAYLNQNFYGNQSYGVAAAAKSYFGKSLADLTLAQDAILAAIPQSPTKYDLVRNAQPVCLEDVAAGADCTKFKLVVPQDSEIVQRRNHILDLMKTRSVLSGGNHTFAEYDAAKDEPVELVQQVSATWKAPQFVWQVRHQLGQIFCPETPDDCPKVDAGGLPGHHHPRLEHAEGRREVGLRRGPGTQRLEPHGGPDARRRSPSPPRAGSSACAATTSTTPRPRSWTTAPATCWPTSAAPATRPRATSSSSPSSTCCPTAGGSRDRRSSRSTT